MTTPTTPTSTSTRIAIVGAGLAGLTTALFLHRLNLAITIYESRPRNASDGGFLALAPNAACVLDQLGLYQDLLNHGYTYEEYTFLSSRNCSKIGTILNGSVERYGYPALRISRHVLRQKLLDAVVDAGIEVKFKHKLFEINETSTGVTLTFSITISHAQSQSQTTDPYTYLLATDGIHSRVRQLVFPSCPLPTYTGQCGIGGGQVSLSSLPAANALPIPNMILGPTNSVMLMPSTPSGDVINISVTLEIPERDRTGWSDLASDKEALKNILVERHCDPRATGVAVWPKIVQESCESANASSLSLWPFYTAPTLDS